MMKDMEGTRIGFATLRQRIWEIQGSKRMLEREADMMRDLLMYGSAWTVSDAYGEGVSFVSYRPRLP